MKRILYAIKMSACGLLIISVILGGMGGIKANMNVSNIHISPVKAYKAAASETSYLYGKLLDNATLLNSDTLEPIVLLPRTYYVTITNQNETHYFVTYNNISGAIEREYIEEETREPVAKFASFYFLAEKDYDSQNPTLAHSEPTWDSPVTVQIPFHETAYIYGSLSGDAKKGTENTEWYYVRYESSYGYVHSLEGIADTFYENSGAMIEPKKDSNSSPETGIPQKIKLEWIYAMALGVPALAIMLAVFKKRKKA